MIQVSEQMRGVNTALAGVSRADTTSNSLNRALDANVSCDASQQKQPLLAETTCFQFLLGPPPPLLNFTHTTAFHTTNSWC